MGRFVNAHINRTFWTPSFLYLIKTINVVVYKAIQTILKQSAG